VARKNRPHRALLLTLRQIIANVIIYISADFLRMCYSCILREIGSYIDQLSLAIRSWTVTSDVNKAGRYKASHSQVKVKAKDNAEVEHR